MLVTIRDETASGKITHQLTLDVLDETLTVRDLIRSRVYQEVDDHNRKVREAKDTAPHYTGLVVPSDTERQLNGPRPVKTIHRAIDWKQQFHIACDAFERNAFFVLIDDKQAENLDDMVTLKSQSQISFLKLGRIVGG